MAKAQEALLGVYYKVVQMIARTLAFNAHTINAHPYRQNYDQLNPKDKLPYDEVAQKILDAGGVTLKITPATEKTEEKREVVVQKNSDFAQLFQDPTMKPGQSGKKAGKETPAPENPNEGKTRDQSGPASKVEGAGSVDQQGEVGQSLGEGPGPAEGQ